MGLIEMVLMIYAVACVLSSKRSQQEEKRKNICDMEGAELDAVGWHEEPEIEIIQEPQPMGDPETCAAICRQPCPEAQA